MAEPARREQLPVELIVQIIGIVADGYRDSVATQRHPLIFSTLATASLVSRTWNTICRTYIFHTINITTAGDPEAQFSFLHFEAPHLSVHIHKLNLKWDGRCISDDYDWLSDCFRQMKNLRELDLHAEESMGQAIRGSRFRRHYVAPEGMKPMLAAPCLRRLVLCGWHFAEDGTDLAAMLPDTIEELVLERVGLPPRPSHALPDDEVMPDSHSNAPPSNVRRLEYLRSIELIHIFHPLLGLKTFIKCPNLVRFYVGWSELDPTRWDFPPWIPARLSELGLQTNLYSHTPRFGASIQPSEVKIEIHGQEGPPPPYSAFLPRIRACLNHLHFPHLIQTLTINIMSYEDDGRDCLYPKLSDYEALSEFFQQLRGCEGGKLKAILLNIKMESQVDEGSIGDRPASDLEWLEDGGPTEHDESSNVDFPNNELHVDEARETTKLQQGFAELLKDNMLNVEFTLERLSIWGGASKVLTHCSIRTM